LLICGVTAALWSKLEGEVSPQWAQSAVPSAERLTPAGGAAPLTERDPPEPAGLTVTVTSSEDVSAPSLAVSLST
jgi:hypothetical protein